PLASLRLAKLGDLAAALATPGPGPVVLDVRRRLEWAESYIAGARHIPFSELPGRAGELPAGEGWVHCQGGGRALVAASLLGRGAGAGPVGPGRPPAPGVGRELHRGCPAYPV